MNNLTLNQITTTSAYQIFEAVIVISVIAIASVYFHVLTAQEAKYLFLGWSGGMVLEYTGVFERRNLHHILAAAIILFATSIYIVG